MSEFIRSPDLFQFDLFESPTITQLKGDSEHGHLYQLLEIILNGNLSVSSPNGYHVDIKHLRCIFSAGCMQGYFIMLHDMMVVMLT